ncbi:MAG: hypothetical protein COA86_11555 [Kangiella sp.]|nr:MAG: hypothetical protein COA86_11555 [Kangiella sp.]
MSILLDSLKQNKDDEGIAVPSVHDSHFDDDMLNDDDLIRSNQLWKLISILLLIVLSISWIYFYLNIPRISDSLIKLSSKLIEEKPTKEQVKKLTKQSVAETSEANKNKVGIIKPSAVLANNKSNDDNDNLRNNQYQPKKRENLSDSFSRVNTSKENISNTNSIQKNEASQSISYIDFSNKPYSSEDAIFYEELSTELLMNLPNLDIDSYAVSSNPKKSFIVLNGSFYGEGETIAPNLKLLSIDKKNVLFKYKNQLIKKNYK